VIGDIRQSTFDPYSFPLARWWFERPESVHGVSHTRRVLIHATAIAEHVELDEVEFASLVTAVAWHDIGRTHDGWDREHGAKSIAQAKRLDLPRGVGPDALTRAFFAIEFHSTDDDIGRERGAALPDSESLLRVLWLLKDADGLDRVRIDDLDPGRLRFPAARGRVAEAWRLLRELP
jgi:HD superfamily phosphodiesterase